MRIAAASRRWRAGRPSPAIPREGLAIQTGSATEVQMPGAEAQTVNAHAETIASTAL